MNRLEDLIKLFENENGGLIAAIAEIVAVFSIDRITKNHCKTDMKKDSISLSPPSAALATDEGEETETS